MTAYEIRQFDADRHEFHVRMTLADVTKAQLRLCMPAWIPGSYMVRDFARNITAISASSENGPVDMRRVDKQTWEIDGAYTELRIDYTVYAFDVSVRTSYLDRRRAFFNGSSLFLYAVGRAQGPWSLVLNRPRFASASQWEVATTLPVAEVDQAGFGRYSGHGYDQLIDHPVEIGDLTQLTFAVAEIPHRMAVSGARAFDCERVSGDLARICAEHVGLFGELPLDRYLFQVLATADGYGGLEHRDSTSLVCKHTDLPRPALQDPDKGYRQFLGLCSHEYFHLWNVKRIQPARLAESDLSAEAYTELLWAFEGITSYYDDLALMRSGTISQDSYLELLANVMTRVMRTPGRHRQSAAESSFYAWTKFYKQDENASNAIVSYYAKGALIAFGLDVTIRLRSDNRYSLDDLMRTLWQAHGRSALGVDERGIERILEQLVGQSFEDFFTRYVYGVDELPLAEWCAAMGLGFRLRPSVGEDDNGGCRPEAPEDQVGPAIGAKFEDQRAVCRIAQVFDAGAAQRAGIAPGDVLIAIDGMRATADNVSELLDRAVGDRVSVHFFRRDQLQESTLVLAARDADTCDLWMLPDAAVSSGVALRRTAWTRSRTHSGQ